MSTIKTYEARFVADAHIVLDGVLAEPAWDQASVEREFCFPWEDRPVPATEFRAVYDTSDLYFSFRVEDDDVVLAEPFQGKEDVMHEDRVELFFALDEQLRQYFALEIDPLGRVLDYRASYYRRFDVSWSFPGLDTSGMRTDNGYVVEGRIAWDQFQSLGFPPPDSGQAIKFGIYRAEFRHAEEAQCREGWISWVDPRTEEPDFHVPQSFGDLKLVKS